MKLASSLVVTLGVPAFAFFVVTASPARLYAEAAAAPPACSAPEVTACADAAASSACAYDGGSGFCQSNLCSNYTVDGGNNETTLVCKPFVPNCTSEQQLADCVGKSAGDACGTNVGGGGHCGALNCGTVDGGTAPTLACLYTGGEIQPEAGPRDDGGPTPDAARNDAAPTGDGSTSTTPPPASDDEGCSVAVAGAPASALGPAATLLMMALAFASRRRR